MSGDVAEGLRRNELDVGFYLGDPKDHDPSQEISSSGTPSLFYAYELAQLTYRVVAPPSLAALVREGDWSLVASLPWIGTPHASVHNRLLTRLFTNLGLRQNIVCRSRSGGVHGGDGANRDRFEPLPRNDRSPRTTISRPRHRR